MIRHVGAWSWEDNSLFASGENPLGWTHTSDWLKLSLSNPATFTLTPSGAVEDFVRLELAGQTCAIVEQYEVKQSFFTQPAASGARSRGW